VNGSAAFWFVTAVSCGFFLGVRVGAWLQRREVQQAIEERWLAWASKDPARIEAALAQGMLIRRADRSIAMRPGAVDRWIEDLVRDARTSR
jgi:hypothetical protein